MRFDAIIIYKTAQYNVKSACSKCSVIEWIRHNTADTNLHKQTQTDTNLQNIQQRGEKNPEQTKTQVGEVLHHAAKVYRFSLFCVLLCSYCLILISCYSLYWPYYVALCCTACTQKSPCIVCIASHKKDVVKVIPDRIKMYYACVVFNVSRIFPVSSGRHCGTSPCCNG